MPKKFFNVSAVIFLLLLLPVIVYGRGEDRRNFTKGIGHKEFATLIEQFSEADNTEKFNRDNFISNETSYLDIFPGLFQFFTPGNGVYIGVGPDQNFTYIAQTKPQIAFITDIRRQNLLEHLLFKACFELAPTRREYLQILFARKGTGVNELLEAAYGTSDSALTEKYFTKICQLITREYQVKLTEFDILTLKRVYQQFNAYGGHISYGVNDISLKDLVNLKDLNGNLLNYLRSEEAYQYLREMQRKNLIIPIVADLSGTKALPLLAAWLRQQGLVVSFFYMSNVEDYLNDSLGAPIWPSWYHNLKLFPLDYHSVIIRTAYEHDGNGVYNHPLMRAYCGWITMAYYIRTYLDLYPEHPANYDLRYQYYLNTH